MSTGKDFQHPLKRARVLINAAELPGGRGVLTDDSGVYEITELPAGRYTVNVSKTGFVALSYGQRRPLRPGHARCPRKIQRRTGCEGKISHQHAGRHLHRFRGRRMHGKR